jgi:Ni/Co efflux regulator RcnB
MKMNKITLAVAVAFIATSTCLSGFSYADGPDGQRDQHWQSRQEGPRDQGGRDDHGGFRGGDRDHEHVAWNNHEFRRGYPAPERYRDHDYRVDNWRERGLGEPPEGHYWADIDGNYVLMAVATGIITSIIIDNSLDR